MEKGKFTDPIIGQCHYTSFYITNQLYGGYSAKCAKGSISVEYEDAGKVVDLAEKNQMDIYLAGDAWIEVGRTGWGEKVTPTEAKKLLEELKHIRGF